jgi:hypothetical protein
MRLESALILPRPVGLSLRLLLLVLISSCAPAVSVTAPTAPPVTTPGGTSYPGPASTITPDATQSFIVGLKSTDLARVELTETAAPTNTPLAATPTFPASAASCHASDLAVSDRTGAATGTIVIQVSIANVSQLVCYLQGPPAIQLVDLAGQPLDVAYSTACFQCGNVDSLGTAMPPATQTAEAQSRLEVKLGLGLGERLTTMELWNNWCKPFPVGGVKVRLALPGAAGIVDGPPDVNIGGRCDVEGAPSTLVTGAYERPN